MENVNWAYLSKAIDYYRDLDYTYVEVPWFIPMSTMMITCPTREHAYEIKHGDGLVGSSEQSLMQMTIEGKLVPGRYVACSPCFRDEPVDSIHQKQFMKVELYDTLNVDTQYNPTDYNPHKGIYNVAEHALGFFETFGLQRGWKDRLDIVETEYGLDIELYGIELGSYGQRDYEIDGKKYSHVYGTGLAEPRFSHLLQMILKSRLKY